MQNPNAIAALVAGAITLGIQWLVQRYAHVAFTGYWKDAVTGATVVTVLYVGKSGLKAALQRLWNGPKKIWAGVAGSTATK